jgi:hypothetical protein
MISMADPEQDDPTRHVPPPTGCVLWRQPEFVAAAKDRFEAVEVFVDESHFSRTLVKCRECGQLYFSQFYEEVDWDDGDDPQYSTYVPVAAPEQIAALKQSSIFEVWLYSPRLQYDFPKGAKAPTVRWIGKDF